ncbi:MAG: PhoH family protein [Verrucomicrobia bacterium]|nr:PhoH family protein [Verrucomicrobiota bacterium]
MTKKTFVIDTNVFLHDPDALNKFQGQHLVIPLTVLEELDQKKHGRDELARNARTTIRSLDTLRLQGKGNWHRGIEMENGSTIRIALEEKGDPAPLLPSSSANKIILSALRLQESGEHVVFVSKDLGARVKAEAVGLEAEEYRSLRIAFDTIYTGIRTLEVTKREVDLFFKDGAIPIPPQEDLRPNEYFILKGGEQSSAIGKFNKGTGKVESLISLSRDIWGIKPINTEQRCAVDLLLRDDVPLVTLMGPAGTGKTLLALAVGLRKVFDEVRYSRILCSRPIMPLGKDIGYLPGTKEEKLQHWMQPIHDNLEVLCAATSQEPTDTFRWILDSNKIEMEAVTYIRGRSLPKAFIIIDEAQNLTPHELKTVISRAGKGSKVVLTGDPTQIDNPYLDKDSNGLTFTVGRFQHSHLFGHILLEKTERSELAALAAEVM